MVHLAGFLSLRPAQHYQHYHRQHHRHTGNPVSYRSPPSTWTCPTSSDISYISPDFNFDSRDNDQRAPCLECRPLPRDVPIICPGSGQYGDRGAVVSNLIIGSAWRPYRLSAGIPSERSWDDIGSCLPHWDSPCCCSIC